MVRSLRVRLQLWYAVVLVAALAGFAAIVYLRARSALFAGIDSDLEAAAHYLDVHLRRFDPEEFSGAPPAEPVEGFRKKGRKPPPPKPPPGFEGSEEKRSRPPPPPPPPERADLLEELALAGRAGARTYFGIWREDGSIVKADNLPDGVVVPALIEIGPGIPFLAQRGPYREAAMRGPPGSRILVGRSIDGELAELHAFAWRLAGAGALVLAIGLAGGWAVSARILRPVAAISATAAAISATNLAQRIDTEAVDRELAELANVLNETFDRLQAAFERQARFTADASHELRTPLTILRSNAELALARTRPPEEYRAALMTCLRSADRMAALVDGLLTLARADAGKIELHDEMVDLKDLVEDSLEMVRPLAQEKRITLTRTLDSAIVKGDPLRLGQVITNLVNNAVQHNTSGGDVHVALGVESSSARLSVSDTGPGIPPQDRPHIFERFFRVDRARARASGGVGLGLAICKNIVEAHGGTIDCESEPGQGCTFWVRLPIVYSAMDPA